MINFNFIGATPFSNAQFGLGTGPIYLDDLRCVGLENRIFDCPGVTIEGGNCGHSSDAGVRCVAGGNILWLKR